MSQESLITGGHTATPGHSAAYDQPPQKKYVPHPINQEQIRKAKEVIKENHPLNDAPLYQVFPILTPVIGCCYKDRSANQQPLIDEESNKDKKKKSKKKQPKLSEEMREDPFNSLGFGMVAYRDLMFVLMLLFGVLTVIMLPVIYIYKGHSAIVNPSGFSQFSLGNMGYSGTQCQRIPFSLKKITMFCSFGFVTDIKYLGINPDGIADRDSCLQTDQNKVCVDHINPNFMTSFQTVAQKNDMDDFSKSFTEVDIFVDPANVPAQCKNNEAQIYVQYSCEQPKKLLERKYTELSYVSCLGIFAASVFAIVIYFFKRTSKLNQLSWDVSTITPGDYTLYYEINDEAYEWFIENIYRRNGDEENGISAGMSFKLYLKAEIERILTEKLEQMRRETPEECTSINIREVKIADIVFSFNNAELINLLKERGQNIMYQRFDKMRQVENKISELKNLRFKDLTKPCEAFITFEEEDGSIVGQKFEPEFSFSGKRQPAELKLLGQEFFLQESTEPTNIIWENRHWTAQDYIKRTAIVFTIISLLIIVSFGLIFFCKSYSMQIFQKYPTVECEVIKRAYTSTNGTNLLPRYAQREFDGFYKPDAGHEPTPFSGALQCQCVKLQTEDKINLFTYQTPDTQEFLCKQYFLDYWMSFATSNAVQYMIVGINYILRLFIIKLIIYIGKDTESEQTRLITNGVFIVQFFNTAFLLLLVNANLTEQVGFLGVIFKGKIGDFNSFWFGDIGKTLVGAMMFNVYWPVMEAGVWFGYRLAFRLLDRRFKSCNDEVTNKTTIQQYVEIYSGPVFFIHYKYSSILNITFVTMMYGLGIPILFPIASISMFTLYMVEKVMVYYSYRQPPMYDEKLNNNVLSLMTYAPLMFLAFGYWMLSSKQLLSNNVNYIEKANSIPATGHVWSTFFKADGYQQSVALPLIVMFWIFLFGTLFKNIIYKYLGKFFPRLIKVGDFEIDENLDTYFNTIDEHDRNWSIIEEENARRTFRLSILTDETLTKFKDTKLGQSQMKGVHCYDILANPLYLDDFQYFSPAMEDREKYIIDDDDDEDNDTAQSDLVKMILNLAFLTEKQAKEFTFSKDAYKNQLMPKFKNNLIQ